MHKYLFIITLSLTIVSCQNWENRQFNTFYSYLSDTTGLKNGTLVECKGIRTGRLKNISTADNGYIVQFSLSKELRIPYGSSILTIQDGKKGLILSIKATHAKKYYGNGDTLKPFIPQPDALELEPMNEKD